MLRNTTDYFCLEDQTLSHESVLKLHQKKCFQSRFNSLCERKLAVLGSYGPSAVANNSLIFVHFQLHTHLHQVYFHFVLMLSSHLFFVFLNCLKSIFSFLIFTFMNQLRRKNKKPQKMSASRLYLNTSFKTKGFFWFYYFL